MQTENNTEVQEQIEREQAIAAIAQSMEEKEYHLFVQATKAVMEEKLQKINQELWKQRDHDVVKYISCRMKRPQSIYGKLLKKGKEPTFANALISLSDIIGMRVVCVFVDDIYKIVAMIKEDPDLVVKNEKDYIANPKKNGYRSYHMILNVPITVKGYHFEQRMELQLRTMSMDFWSVLDHQMIYKKKDSERAKQAAEQLQIYAREIVEMDQKMVELRKSIENI